MMCFCDLSREKGLICRPLAAISAQPTETHHQNPGHKDIAQCLSILVMRTKIWHSVLVMHTKVLHARKDMARCISNAHKDVAQCISNAQRCRTVSQ